MRTLSIAIAATLLFLANRAQADPPRHPLSGSPRTARGVVDRIVLFQKQLFLHEGDGSFSGIVALQGSVLTPVSEDSDGIYYQAPNGVCILDRNGSGFLPLPGILYPGGLFSAKPSRTTCTRIREMHGNKIITWTETGVRSHLGRSPR